MTLRRKLSVEDQDEANQHEQQEQTAHQLRKAVDRFRVTLALPFLCTQLPLRFPSPQAAPLTFRALRWYTYSGWEPLTHRKQLDVQRAFYVALLLVDFAPLRAELMAWTGIHLDAPGQTPYDPVSLFLCCLLRWEMGLGWKSLAKLLARPEGACWHELFGFRDGQTPCASAMRAFYKSLGGAFDTDLCPRFIELIDAAGLLAKQTTHPRTPAQRGLPVAADGMLHEAHTSMRCGQVTATCYEPTFPQQPSPCPARDKGFAGCTCTEHACAQRCRLTTPRDPEARLIHYTGSNQCRLRGYDHLGHPLCAHGYPLSFNGLDYQRLRACRQVCTQQLHPQAEDAACPFRDPQHPLGMVKHVQRAFTHADGSRHERLARLYPYNSPLWKEH